MSAALASAMLAGPGATVAAAQMSSGVQAAVAAESPAQRAIEIREGGLPLQIGSQGELVAHVQRALGIPADGIFGPQTDAAVRQYQANAGLQVDGIVGLATWGALFESGSASASASAGGYNVPDEVKQRIEQRLVEAGAALEAQGQASSSGDSERGTAAPAATGTRMPRRADRIRPARRRTSPPSPGLRTRRRPPAATRAPTSPAAAPPSSRRPGRTAPIPGTGSCSSSTLANPVKGTLSSPYRAALGTNARGPGHLRAERNADPGRCLRLGQLRRPAERLREHRLHHPHEPVLDVLRAHVALCHVAGRSRAAGPGDRLRRLHRQLHRPAPALRDPGQRPGAGSGRATGPAASIPGKSSTSTTSAVGGPDLPASIARVVKAGKKRAAATIQRGGGVSAPARDGSCNRPVPLGPGERSGGAVVARGSGHACGSGGHARRARLRRLRSRPRLRQLPSHRRLRTPAAPVAPAPAPVTPAAPRPGRAGRPGPGSGHARRACGSGHPGGPGRAGSGHARGAGPGEAAPVDAGSGRGGSGSRLRLRSR